jgi:hypothetical protein
MILTGVLYNTVPLEFSGKTAKPRLHVQGRGGYPYDSVQHHLYHISSHHVDLIFFYPETMNKSYSRIFREFTGLSIHAV